MLIITLMVSAQQDMKGFIVKIPHLQMTWFKHKIVVFEAKKERYSLPCLKRDACMIKVYPLFIFQFENQNIAHRANCTIINKKKCNLVRTYKYYIPKFENT